MTVGRHPEAQHGVHSHAVLLSFILLQYAPRDTVHLISLDMGVYMYYKTFLEVFGRNTFALGAFLRLRS